LCIDCTQSEDLHILKNVLLMMYAVILRSWSYGGWNYNYLSNLCLSPLKLWIRLRSWRDELNTTLCDQVCQWLTTGWCFSTGTPVSCTNKTDRHDITEILLKVALNTVTHKLDLFWKQCLEKYHFKSYWNCKVSE
jgi:hypothetical protein